MATNNQNSKAPVKTPPTPNKKLLDMFEKYHYDRNIVRKSQSWFDKEVAGLMRKRITPNQVVKAKADHMANVVVPGRMYMFFYDPKTKAELPYYDRFPMVFPFSFTEDGFIGLNLHYLPHKLRFTLFDRLLAFKNNDNFDESTKLRYSWAAINGMSKFALAKPCVKRYIKSHLRSPLIQITSEDWATAMMLPVERFVGAQNQQVWAESKRSIR